MSSDLGFIHRFVPGDDARAPLLLLHGTGGDENDLIPLANRVAPGATLLSPRGKSNEHGMARFFRRSPDGVWDIEDFKSATTDLAEFVRRAATAYGIGKPFALGYSNGANIGWSLLLKAPDLLAGAVLLRAMLPFDPRPLPSLADVPVLLIAGRHDELIPVERAGLLAALLGEAGAKVTYEVLPAGHGLTDEDLRLASGWLASHR
jgi:phospholipase/carboxylesterase